jgi:hypothetical protein
VGQQVRPQAAGGERVVTVNRIRKPKFNMVVNRL